MRFSTDPTDFYSGLDAAGRLVFTPAYAAATKRREAYERAGRTMDAWPAEDKDSDTAAAWREYERQLESFYRECCHGKADRGSEPKAPGFDVQQIAHETLDRGDRTFGARILDDIDRLRFRRDRGIPRGTTDAEIDALAELEAAYAAVRGVDWEVR